MLERAILYKVVELNTASWLLAELRSCSRRYGGVVRELIHLGDISNSSDRVVRGINVPAYSR